MNRLQVIISIYAYLDSSSWPEVWRKLDNRARTLRSDPSTAAAILSLDLSRVQYPSKHISAQVRARSSRNTGRRLAKYRKVVLQLLHFKNQQLPSCPHVFVDHCSCTYIMTNMSTCTMMQTCEISQKNEKEETSTRVNILLTWLKQASCISITKPRVLKILLSLSWTPADRNQITEEADP